WASPRWWCRSSTTCGRSCARSCWRRPGGAGPRTARRTTTWRCSARRPRPASASRPPRSRTCVSAAGARGGGGGAAGGGRVRRAVVDGEVLVWDDAAALALGAALRALPRYDVRELTVEGLFEHIEAKLKGDAGTRNYATAVFDPGDGHTVRYVRRVRGSRERE